MKLVFFTSAALNYLPKVRRLVKSIHDYHPEANIVLALADLLPDPRPHLDAFDRVIDVTALKILNWRGWSFGHTIVELATAIKPFVLSQLLDESDDTRVIYLDPDTVLYDRLDDVLESLEYASIALTPHLVSPENDIQGILDNEMAALKHGVYNLGFIAVRSSQVGRAFADWWKTRCLHWCIDDIPNGLFTDQRWIDLVPALFPEVAILRTPRHNVAPWNIANRLLEYRDGRYWVGKEPLGFYHFTGLDSGAHDIMAARYGTKSKVVYDLINDYKVFLKQASQDPLCSHSWAFANFSNGEPIPLAARRLYRNRTDLQQAFPDPYDEQFQSWWHQEGHHQVLNRNINLVRKPRLADMTIPQNIPLYLRRCWRILQTEGVSGIMNRLRGM